MRDRHHPTSWPERMTMPTTVVMPIAMMSAGMRVFGMMLQLDLLPHDPFGSCCLGQCVYILGL